MILQVEEVSSIEGIIVRYVNHLLHNEAVNQHMLQTQKPADERVMDRLQEVRAKNTSLEMENRALRSALEGLEAQATIAASQQTVRFTSDVSGPVTHLKPRIIDGDTAIREGKAAHDAFVTSTQQPPREV